METACSAIREGYNRTVLSLFETHPSYCLQSKCRIVLKGQAFFPEWLKFYNCYSFPICRSLSTTLSARTAQEKATLSLVRSSKAVQGEEKSKKKKPLVIVCIVFQATGKDDLGNISTGENENAGGRRVSQSGHKKNRPASRAELLSS